MQFERYTCNFSGLGVTGSQLGFNINEDLM